MPPGTIEPPAPYQSCDYAADVAARDAVQNNTTRTDERLTENEKSGIYLAPVPNYREWSENRDEYGRA